MLLVKQTIIGALVVPECCGTPTGLMCSWGFIGVILNKLSRRASIV
ncbi:MAG: hypothetical protein QW566_06575 [Candidatus Jordarchaeales archaeon]